MHVSVQPTWPWPLVAIGGALLAAIVVGVFAGSRVRQWDRLRWAAFAMRGAALVLALAAMLRPALVFTETKKQSATLIMLYDRSSSMLVADAWDGLPRWRALDQIVTRARPALKELGELIEVREYQFDAGIAESMKLDAPPDGQQTAIGKSLREALDKTRGRVAAVILLSDGANRTDPPPLAVARTMKDSVVPLYTVGFGKPSAVDASRDLALRTITAGPTVFEKNRLVVTGELESRGFRGSSVQVKLLFDGMNADQRIVEVPADDARIKVELGHVPTIPGEHKVTLEVAEPDPPKGELVQSNNTISTFVTVLKGGLRVLIIDGGAESFESRYIRWSLDKSPDVQADFVWPRDDQALRDAATLFDPARYDVFLIRDVPRAWIADAALERLRQAVESGAGFVMIGGRRSFGPGGYANTPIAALLPVQIHPGDGQIQRPLPVRATAQGVAHFVMRLGSPEDTPKIWESLHPLDGAASFSDVKDQARVLAESPDRVPLVIAQDFARGRTMAVAGDTTRHWYRQSEQGSRHHRRFWRQVVLWLARKDQAGEDRVWVELDKRRLAAGERLNVTAGAEDEQGNPLRDVQFEATVTPNDAPPLPLKFAQRGEHVLATFHETKRSGDYQVSLIARRNGQPLGAPHLAKFTVYEDDSELSAPAADIALLEQMATITGGEYVPPERLTAFLESLREKDLHLEVERLTQVRLWDNWYFFLAFVALLVAEWTLRKWKGLV